MKVVLDSVDSYLWAKIHLDNLLNKRDFTKVMTIKSPKAPRSLNQNRLLWLWLTCLEVDSETGYTKEEFYQYFLESFAPRKTCRDKEILATSSQMDKAMMTDFLERIKMFAWHELNCNLPNPEDKGFNEFYKRYHEK